MPQNAVEIVLASLANDRFFVNAMSLSESGVQATMSVRNVTNRVRAFVASCGSGGRLGSADASNPRARIGRRLDGDVLEIGPGSKPFPVAVGARVVFADRHVPGGRDLVWPELSGQPRGPEADLCVDLDTQGLLGVRDESFDAVIASHVVEHLANPIAAMLELDRVLRVGGELVLVVPDRSRTFDSLRPGTTMAHLFEEFRRGETLVDDEHIREFCKSLYAQPAIHPEAVREWHNPARLNEDLYELHRLRTIHVHCWTSEEFAVLLAGVVATGLARWTLRDLYLAEDVGGTEGIEFGFALGKVAGRGTGGQDSERFLSDWMDLVLADPRRDVQHCVAIGEVIARDFCGQTIFPDILAVPLKRLSARIVALRSGAR